MLYVSYLQPLFMHSKVNFKIKQEEIPHTGSAHCIHPHVTLTDLEEKKIRTITICGTSSRRAVSQRDRDNSTVSLSQSVTSKTTVALNHGRDRSSSGSADKWDRTDWQSLDRDREHSRWPT